MKIYHYAKDTGEYLGSSDAWPDPLEDGRFLIPAHASETAPPNTSDNEVAVFSSGSWEVLPDFRGVDYWLAYSDKHTIMEIGETVPNGAFLAEPEPPPTPVPTSATPAQGLMALYQLKGITEDDIETAVAGIADPGERYAAQIAYRKTTTWEKDSPSMQSFGALLQLTEQDFVDLFTLAPTIKL